MKTTPKRVLEVARSWVGYHFNRGYSAQCANFVRAVFREAGAPLPVAARPSDWNLTKHLPQGSAYANSLAGDEIGKRIVNIRDLQPGDIILYRDTYNDPTFPPGCITHVGIASSVSEMIDRPTAAEPVKHRPIWPGLFFEARRPWAYEAEPASEAPLVVKLYHDNDRSTLVIGDRKLRVQESQRPALLVDLEDGSTFKLFFDNGRATGVLVRNGSVQTVAIDQSAQRPILHLEGKERR